MRSVFVVSTQVAVTTALALVLCAGMVGAQDSLAKHHDGDEGVPTPIAYPAAAPGTLDMYHWTNYTRKHMSSGSATEATMDKMHEADKMHAMMRDDDEEDRAPAPSHYPAAAPGALDMHHWSDYTMKHMKSGSAHEAMMDKMHEKDMRMGKMHDDDDEDNIMPTNASYPAAGPGAIDMSHWSDYTMKHMRMGSSSSEAHEEKMKKKDDKRMQK